MKRAFVLAKKELRDVLRERSIVLALITQAFVAAFSGFLTLGLVGLYDPETVGARPDLRIDYVGPGDFLAYLHEEGFQVTSAPSPEAAFVRFQEDAVDVVVEESYLAADRTRVVSLLLADGELETTLAVTRLKDVLRDYERDLREERAERITTPVLYVTTSAPANPYFGFAYAVLLPLLLLTPVFLAGATTADSMVQELATRTILILRSAPLTPLEIVVGKLLLNRLDDELWPEAGITKADLIDYYLDAADRLLPFVANRPVSLLRAPDPITGECAYQKTAPAGLPPWIPTRRIRSEHAALGYADYVLVGDRATLVYLVNLGFISLHPWGCTIDALDRPDIMALDLDPTEIAFREVRNAAMLVRDLLGSYRVRSWVKTSGGRGLHILIPLQPLHTFAQVRTAAETITRLARSREPSLFTLDMRRARRRGKILIDVHRNHRGATLVSPWAVREYPAATVSTPVEWSELERGMYPEDFTLATIRERLARPSDPFASFYREPQALTALLESGRSRRARPLA